MKYKAEFEAVLKYIDDFDTEEFSSSEKLVIKQEPDEERLQQAQRLKARLNRKHKMDLAFEESLAKNNFGNNSVTISQEEIDALLESNM